MEPQKKDIEEKLIDIIDCGMDVSDEQTNAVGDDSDMLDAYLRLNDAAMLLDDEPVDVDSQLERFHDSHKHNTKNTKVWRIGIALVAAAAIAALFILKDIHKPKVNLNDSPITYQQVSQLKGATIISSSGKRVKTTENKGEENTYNGSFNVLDEKESDVVLTAAVPSGSSYEVTLADGTRVYLHANSRLVFPTRFVGDKREVLLNGEAYFVVSHNPDHPFVVHTDKLQTVVLGTEFYLRAYGNNRDNVTLVTGSVQVSDSHNEVNITPGQQAYVGSGNLSVRKVDLRPYIYWRNGYLFYDHMSIRKIIEDIAKDYNYTVDFETDEPLDSELRFVADRTHGISEVLSTLSDLADISLEVDGTTIVVRDSK